MRLLIAMVCLFLSFESLANEKGHPLKNTHEIKEKAATKDEAPPNIGNFALPSSQQPGPLIGFGEHILDKNKKQLLLFIDDFGGVDKHFVDVAPSLVYGITDNFSAILNVPIGASFRQDENRSDGFEDLIFQLEYAFYNKKTKAYQRSKYGGW